MRNAAGGPWDFWIEMKGINLGRLKADGISRGKARPTPWNPDQKRWAAHAMAACVPVFVLWGSRHVLELLEAVGYPHRIKRTTGTKTADGREVTMEHVDGLDWRVLPREGEAEQENDAQKAVKRILEAHGFHISDTSQGYRPGGRGHGTTRITKGLPDLYVTHPALDGGGLWTPTGDRP